jgi:hypothetical protein
MYTFTSNDDVCDGVPPLFAGVFGGVALVVVLMVVVALGVVDTDDLGCLSWDAGLGGC